jgi:hypothetical protein
MKSIFSSTGFIVFLMVLTLARCKKDSENSFIGKWDVTTHVYTVYLYYTVQLISDLKPFLAHLKNLPYFNSHIIRNPQGITLFH